MRFVVTGGGTGGHIMPALAVAESLGRLQPDTEVLYIGSTTGMETQLVPQYGVPYQGITARKLRRLVSPGTLGVLASLATGYREARTYLRAFGAQAIVSTGGYVAAATAIAGARLKLPVVIVEGNAVPGRTNLLVARYARKVCVAFAQTAIQFPAGKTVETGLPLRSGVIAPESLSQRDARCRLPGLLRDRFTLLVVGGSQGARALNEAAVRAVPQLLTAGVQVLHQTGARNIDAVQAAAAALEVTPDNGYVALPFLDSSQMPLALRAADLVVCRGGISTISEVTASGLPAIVVPLPTAYADHQTANALELVRAGAARLMPETALCEETLASGILQMRDNRDLLHAMGAASRAMGRPRAADDVARITLELVC